MTISTKLSILEMVQNLLISIHHLSQVHQSGELSLKCPCGNSKYDLECKQCLRKYHKKCIDFGFNNNFSRKQKKVEEDENEFVCDLCQTSTEKLHSNHFETSVKFFSQFQS